jgi:hypothetical protein
VTVLGTSKTIVVKETSLLHRDFRSETSLKSINPLKQEFGRIQNVMTENRHRLSSKHVECPPDSGMEGFEFSWGPIMNCNEKIWDPLKICLKGLQGGFKMK